MTIGQGIGRLNQAPRIEPKHRFAEARSRQRVVRQAFVLRSGNLGRRVASGASFVFLGIAIRTAVTLGSMAILARLLTPADFGYVAMATVVTEFAALLSNFGFSAVLIQRRVIRRIHLDTVFWIGVAMGVLLTSIVYAISFFTGPLFSDPFVGDLLRISALNFLIGSVVSIHSVVLTRLMNFRVLLWIQVASLVCSTLTAIAFAFAGFGVWSLVAGPIAGSIATVMASAIAVPYLPRLRFSLAYIASTWKTNTSYFGGGLLYYVNMNLDLLLIGRFLGAAPLGFYQNARSLTNDVRSRIAIPLQRVLFPAFSTLQDERPALQAAVMRSGRLLAAIIFPIAVGISATAEEIVPLLYGGQWLPMIPLISILGLSAGVRGATAIAPSLFNAMNRVGRGLRQGVISTVIMVIAMTATFPFGLEAIAWGIALASLYSVVTLRISFSLIGLDTKHVWHMLGPPALASAIMWAAVEAVRSFGTGGTVGLPLALVLHVLAGALVYSGVLLIGSRAHVEDFSVLAKKLLDR